MANAKELDDTTKLIILPVRNLVDEYLNLTDKEKKNIKKLKDALALKAGAKKNSLIAITDKY